MCAHLHSADFVIHEDLDKKNPPRTRQRTLILAAFLPWGGSDDTVTRRIREQSTRHGPQPATRVIYRYFPSDSPSPLTHT